MSDPKSSVRFVDPSRAAAAMQLFSEAERAVLRVVNQKVAAQQSLTAVVDFLFEQTRSIFPFDRIGLSFVEDDGKRVVSHYARTLYEPVLLDEGYAEDLRGSSLDAVLRKRLPRIIDDLEEYLVEHPASRSTKLLVKEGVRSSLTCPLMVEGRVVGFMFRSSRSPHAYDWHHVELQMAIAERISQAVEKAWRIEQLEAAQRAYFEMLGFVAHELKNPVASMVTDAQLLSQGYLGALTPDQKAKIDKFIARGEYLLDLVREYLDLARIEGRELDLDARSGVDFTPEVVDAAVDLIDGLMQARGMTLRRELPTETLLVECDPTLLRIVLVNLLGHAVKYGREGGEIRLAVLRRKTGITVSVWNEGLGFPPQERDKLFRKFSRLDSPGLKARKGTGVGLYNAWRIVQLHGGRIRAAAKQGEWAEFSFSIPQPLPQAADTRAGGTT